MGWWIRRRRRLQSEIQPDEILIDSSNVSDLDTDQFEGRLERPIGRRSYLLVGGIVAMLFLGLLLRAGALQIVQGGAYAARAEQNQLAESVVFADRGVITDRNGVPLAWNERADISNDFAARLYSTLSGLAHVIGYTKPPAKDSSGHYYRTSFVGTDGAERAFDGELTGQEGLKLTETDAKGTVVSQSVIRPAKAGEKLTLSIDSAVTHGLYEEIAQHAELYKFQGGAGVIMDINSGELLALTSFPEYSPEALTAGDRDALSTLLADSRQPFLNRATSGLYAPGSIVKPFVAVGALESGVIDENTQILSTGSISVPNPYDPKHPSVFKDWRANGWVDMRHAIAVSSDVYFYEVGGGFQNQPGLGIDALDKFLRLFGFGMEPGLFGFSEQDGTIPTPAWKEENFPGDPWRIGDTYHTAIGQYGVQVTPLQATRAVAALANGGILLTPTLLASSTPQGVVLKIDPYTLGVVREGMRLGVAEGIAGAVNEPFVSVAAKTGTAQVGTHNEYVNSWIIGFFPYENPRYAFVIVLDRGPSTTVVGAPATMGAFLNWMEANAPQYLKNLP